MKKYLKQWLKRDRYVLQYNIGDNKVYQNDNKVVVIHPKLGLRLMYPLDYFSKEYFKKAIKKDLAEQEK